MGFIDRIEDLFTKDRDNSKQEETQPEATAADVSTETESDTPEATDSLGEVAGAMVGAAATAHDEPADSVEKPETAPKPAPASEEKVTKPAPKSAPVTYTVKPGDNLTFIGQRFNVTVDQLVKANNISNPDLIYPDQVLTIPNQ